MEKEEPVCEVEETEKNQAWKFRERSSLVGIFRGQKLNKHDKYSKRAENIHQRFWGAFSEVVVELWG